MKDLYIHGHKDHCLVSLSEKQQQLFDDIQQVIENIWEKNSSIIGLKPPNELWSRLESIIKNYN